MPRGPTLSLLSLTVLISALLFLKVRSSSLALSHKSRKSSIRNEASLHKRNAVFARKLASLVHAGDDDDDDDDDLNHDPGVDLPHADLTKEEKEDEALFQKAKSLFSAKDVDVHGDSLPESMKDLGSLSKDLGLSEADLKELDDMGRDSKKDDADIMKNDQRPQDALPPLGMVSKAEDMHKGSLDEGHPPAPNEPVKEDASTSAGEGDSPGMRLAQEKAEHALHVAELTRRIEHAHQETADARREIAQAKREASQAMLAIDRSKSTFQRSLDSVREEQKTEKEEMTATIEEQKRAFDELYEEKQLLAQMLSDEQKTLRQLQEKIQHPDLGLWLRQRAERAAILVETPETDAVKYYAKKYMAPKVTKMRHRLQLLERRVERTVDHLLPAKYGGVVALLLSIGLIGFPIFVTMSTVVSVTKSVSLRQYVLLGNVFLTAFAAGLCIAGLLLRQDPLQTLYEASENLFIMLQLATAMAFPVFLGVIGCTVYKSRDRLDTFVFGCELIFYALVGMNYRARVWRPAMLGQNIETSVMMYVVYLMDFVSMTALTVSSARTETSAMVVDVADPEMGDSDSKVVGVTGSGPLLGSRSSRASALGGGLLQAAIGQSNTTGKDE